MREIRVWVAVSVAGFLLALLAGLAAEKPGSPPLPLRAGAALVAVAVPPLAEPARWAARSSAPATSRVSPTLLGAGLWLALLFAFGAREVRDGRDLALLLAQAFGSGLTASAVVLAGAGPERVAGLAAVLLAALLMRLPWRRSASARSSGGPVSAAPPE